MLKKNTLRPKSKGNNSSLNLLNKQDKKLKRRRLLLRLPLPSGRRSKRSRRESQRQQLPLLRLLLLKEKLNLKKRENKIRQSMTQLSRPKLRPSDLHLWLLRLLTSLPKRLEELARKNKLKSTRERWLPEDLLSRKLSEMCGPPDPLVFPCFT